MILSLFEFPEGAPSLPGHRVVYDIDRNEAHFGNASTEGPALVWLLSEYGAENATLSAEVKLDPAVGWLMRCDRIDFPPGGVAHRHTHPGPGIRRLLFGSIRIETAESVHRFGPGGAWFESGPEPVRAAADEHVDSAFVRVLLLPRAWEGKRTISYVDPADEEKPKLQRPTVFFDRSIAL